MTNLELPNDQGGKNIHKRGHMLVKTCDLCKCQMILEEPAVCIRAVCVQPTCTACIVCVCSTLLPIIE